MSHPRIAIDPVVDYLGQHAAVLVTRAKIDNRREPVVFHNPIIPGRPFPRCGPGGVTTCESYETVELGAFIAEMRAEQIDVKPCGSCFGNHQASAGDTPHFPTVGASGTRRRGVSD